MLILKTNNIFLTSYKSNSNFVWFYLYYFHDKIIFLINAFNRTTKKSPLNVALIQWTTNIMFLEKQGLIIFVIKCAGEDKKYYMLQNISSSFLEIL